MQGMNKDQEKEFLNGIYRGILSGTAAEGIFSTSEQRESMMTERISQLAQGNNSIGVLYGVHHMNPIEDFVKNIGYVQDEVLWRTAFRIF